MANISNQQVFMWDVIGVYIRGPLHIRKILLIPSAAGDAAGFVSSNYLSEKQEKYSQTCTVTLTTTITSVGNFKASEVAVGDVIEIYESNSLNKGWFIVNTRPSDDVITVVGTPLTNEAAKVYSWRIYTGFSAGSILSQATNKKQEELDFGQGTDFPGGFGLISLSANAKVYIYR